MFTAFEYLVPHPFLFLQFRFIKYFYENFVSHAPIPRRGPSLSRFFSKTFLLVLLAHSYFFLLFPPFFALLFTGLYFYIQNLRFLNSSSAPLASSPIELGAKNSTFYFYLTLPILFFTVFGCFFIEDLLLFVS